MASVNTHDLPPAAGYLEYGHVKLREQLGLLSGPVEEFQKSAEAEHNAMLSMLVDEGYLDASALEDELANENEIIDALYRGLKGSPCKLMAASIVDAVGEKRTQNQPAPATNIRTGVFRWLTAMAMSCRWSSCSTILDCRRSQRLCAAELAAD